MKFGLVYSVEAPNQQGLGTVYQNILKQVALAEKLGYDAVLISEHHLVEDGYFPSALIAAAGIATQTTRIRVGSGVILLPLHHPLHVAEDAAVLDVISHGRVILGLGYGYRREEFEAFNVPLEERVARFNEGIEIVKRLLSDTNVTFEGKYFRIKNATMTPRPFQKPRPPIWVAAKAERAVRRVARQGDTWFSDPVTPLQVLKQRMQAFREELKKVGRDVAGMELPLMKEGYVAKDADTAWRDVREHVLVNYRHYLRWGHMQDEEGRPVPPDDEKALSLLEGRFVIGSPDDCIAKIERHVKELGVNYMLFRMLWPGIAHEKVMSSIRMFAEKVFPHFQ